MTGRPVGPGWETSGPQHLCRSAPVPGGEVAGLRACWGERVVGIRQRFGRPDLTSDCRLSTGSVLHIPAAADGPSASNVTGGTDVGLSLSLGRPLYNMCAQ